ncbi:MAG: DUF6483 family protein [Ruminococcus flavefaciens]|nr:DUF6483 family protein [Ruminococcus flavefaciens]MCM1230495.1 DUF6483 family protein [Ruminococcus flavefaciens]
MFEQDYIMRQIHQMIKILVRVLFNVDDETPSLSLIQNTEAKETAGNLLRKADYGNIAEAVSELSELVKNETMDNLLIGIVFYSYLNEKDDDYLETNGFSRDSIENGIKYLLSEYGLETMADIFFS